MTHVKVLFVVEEFWYDEEKDEGGSYPEWKFIEGNYKKVIWDGKSLTIGKRKIITSEIISYGKNEIEYLEIDGKVFRDVRPETLQKEKEEREEMLNEFFEFVKEHALARKEHEE